MTAKEFLGQVRWLHQRIDTKLDRIANLEALATKATSTITGMPRSPSPAMSRLELPAIALAELKDDLVRDIMAMKAKIHEVEVLLNRVEDPELQSILEMRYLAFRKLSEIAEDLGYTTRWIYKRHADALAAFEQVMAEAGIK